MISTESMVTVTQAIDNLNEVGIQALQEAHAANAELRAENATLRAERDTWRAKATAAGATS